MYLLPRADTRAGTAAGVTRLGLHVPRPETQLHPHASTWSASRGTVVHGPKVPAMYQNCTANFIAALLSHPNTGLELNLQLLAQRPDTRHVQMGRTLLRVGWEKTLQYSPTVCSNPPTRDPDDPTVGSSGRQVGLMGTLQPGIHPRSPQVEEAAPSASCNRTETRRSYCPAITRHASSLECDYNPGWLRVMPHLEDVEACPIRKTQGDNCRVRDPKTGYEFDLSSLKGRDYPVRNENTDHYLSVQVGSRDVVQQRHWRSDGQATARPPLCYGLSNWDRSPWWTRRNDSIPLQVVGSRKVSDAAANYIILLMRSPRQKLTNRHLVTGLLAHSDLRPEIKVHTFLWLTAAACPLNNSTQHDNLRVTNPATAVCIKDASTAVKCSVQNGSTLIDLTPLIPVNGYYTATDEAVDQSDGISRLLHQHLVCPEPHPWVSPKPYRELPPVWILTATPVDIDGPPEAS
ncbi:cation-independent mannose-6-phosphate receptor [Lates japonicus]|uniref:Cation-independent mannose-6-phosphate receptor n=1 Tax=Lates japonicus TaxID=270547 RepID=A0AAD3QXN2_LATJO|nr:cation-independent mannose-6-phosphate receptor [Lates japonicus]